MNILVVGGAGYIGSHVVHALLQANHNVTVFDNLSSSSRENVSSKTHFIHGDILIPWQIENAVKGHDAVIHLAAKKAAGESMLKPEIYALFNVNGTIHLLNAMCLHNVHHIVFSSSAAVYGEPHYVPIDENHPTQPTNFYGFTKLQIEKLMTWYASLKNISFAALRYFNAAGYDPSGNITSLEQEPANLLPVIMEVACGLRKELHVFGNDYDTKDGTCLRDYIHVSDLAEAHVQALTYICEKKQSLTINLGTGVPISVMEVLHMTSQVIGKDIPYKICARRAGDAAVLCASSQQAYEVLQWKPQMSTIQTLVQSTWAVYQDSASRRSYAGQ